MYEEIKQLYTNDNERPIRKTCMQEECSVKFRSQGHLIAHELEAHGQYIKDTLTKKELAQII